jgi:hypothetical protein
MTLSQKNKKQTKEEKKSSTVTVRPNNFTPRYIIKITENVYPYKFIEEL